MNVLDLFSGIGGFSLGLERAGFKTVAFCEIDPFCRKVLKKHWSDIPIYEDIRTLTRERLISDGIGTIDVITGGFPCQDISSAGKGSGINGKRSGLWSELARIIGEIRPCYAIVENVAALLGGDRGGWFGRVLGDLAEIGYDAEWHCIPASAIGAPHERDRVWIIATNTNSDGLEAYTDESSICQSAFYRGLSRRLGEMGSSGEWNTTRPIGARSMGMDDGISADVDRIKSLGNAVVPQIPEIIGRAIMKAEHEQNLP